MPSAPQNNTQQCSQCPTTLCSAGTPQCFLLTPKLLPDLPFTRDVRVLQIMNGEWSVVDFGFGFSGAACDGLAFTQDVRVLQIMNGRWSVLDFDLSTGKSVRDGLPFTRNVRLLQIMNGAQAFPLLLCAVV